MLGKGSSTAASLLEGLTGVSTVCDCLCYGIQDPAPNVRRPELNSLVPPSALMIPVLSGL